MKKEKRGTVTEYLNLKQVKIFKEYAEKKGYGRGKYIDEAMKLYIDTMIECKSVEIISTIKTFLKRLSSEERVEVFNGFNYCNDCGCEKKDGRRCYCEDDS